MSATMASEVFETALTRRRRAGEALAAARTRLAEAQRAPSWRDTDAERRAAVVLAQRAVDEATVAVAGADRELREAAVLAVAEALPGLAQPALAALEEFERTGHTVGAATGVLAKALLSYNEARANLIRRLVELDNALLRYRPYLPEHLADQLSARDAIPRQLNGDRVERVHLPDGCPTAAGVVNVLGVLNWLASIVRAQLVRPDDLPERLRRLMEV